MFHAGANATLRNLGVELWQHDHALLSGRLIAHADKDRWYCLAAIHRHVGNIGGDEKIVARMGYILLFEGIIDFV